MAVGTAPILRGTALRPGSLRLIALRGVSLVASSAPALIVARRGIAQSLGVVPDVTQRSGAPLATTLVRAAGELPAGFYVAAVLGITVFVCMEQALAATALHLLDPRRPAGPVRVWRALWRYGVGHLPPLLRVALTAFVFGAIGASVLAGVFGCLANAAQQAGWGGVGRALVLPAGQLLVTLGWLTAVGAFATGCRVVVVSDRRRGVLRVAWTVARVWWRSPGRGPLFHVVVATAVQVLGFILLGAAAPRANLLGSLLAWGTYLVVQALAWHWLLHVARRLYADPSFDDLRPALPS